MKRIMILLGCMSLGLAHAQQQGRTHAQHNGATKRVGINTTKPVATMEIRKADGIPATQVQGFLLPHLSQTERNAMEKEALTNGVMIFNTTKNCIDWWDGAHWQCTDGSYQDEHGDDFNPVKSFTGTYTHPITTQSFTKNDCVAPQTGTTVSYTSQAITKTYVSNISQEDANEQAKQQALAEFNQLGQQFANANGACKTTFQAPACTAIYEGAYGIIKETNTNDLIYVGSVTFPLSQSDAQILNSLENGNYVMASAKGDLSGFGGSSVHFWTYEGMELSGTYNYIPLSKASLASQIITIDAYKSIAPGTVLKYGGTHYYRYSNVKPSCTHSWTVQ